MGTSIGCYLKDVIYVNYIAIQDNQLGIIEQCFLPKKTEFQKGPKRSEEHAR